MASARFLVLPSPPTVLPFTVVAWRKMICPLCAFAHDVAHAQPPVPIGMLLKVRDRSLSVL